MTTTMAKTLFIDSTPDIDRVWRKVHRPNDIPIAVNMGPLAASDVPKVIAGYDKAQLTGTGKLKSTDGVFGLRFSHNVEAVITGFSMTKG